MDGSLSAVDCCERSFGTRRADDRLWLGWRRPESSPDKAAQRHRANICSEVVAATAADSSLQQQQRRASRPQRFAPQNEKHRNLALSSPLLHPSQGALPRGRTRARGPSADAIDAPSASSAPRNRHHRRFSRGGRRAVTARAPRDVPRRRRGSGAFDRLAQR